MKQDYQTFIKERASVRHFDSSAVITNSEIEEILKVAATAPSGNNTQPWQVIVVKNKEIQQELAKLSFDRAFIEEASAVFLIFGDIASYDIDRLFDYNLANNLMTANDEIGFKNKMKLFYSLSPIDNSPAALLLDCGLFTMNLLHALRSFDYEAVPMRGTQFEAIKTYLKLPQNWQPIMMVPAGKGLVAGHPKVRKAPSVFSTIIE